MPRIQTKDSSTLSYSQRSTYRSCQSKWYHEYVREEPTGKKGISLIFGEYTHVLLEKYMQEKYRVFATEILDQQFLLDTASTLSTFDAFKDLEVDDQTLAIQLAMRGLLTLKKDFAGAVFYKGEPAIELHLVQEGFYSGIIDLIYADKEDYNVLLDWKTTSWDGYTNHSVKTANQLIGYAYLAEYHSLFIERLAYGVLNKRDRYAKILKVPNTHDYISFKRDVRGVHREIATLNLSTSNTTFFRKDAENCFAYNTKCPFYSQCWSEDKRKVSTITLVPNLN